MPYFRSFLIAPALINLGRLVVRMRWHFGAIEIEQYLNNQRPELKRRVKTSLLNVNPWVSFSR